MDGAASNSSASVYLLSPPVLITIFYTARFTFWAAFAFHSDTYGSSAAMLMVRTNEPMVRFLHHTRGALSLLAGFSSCTLSGFIFIPSTNININYLVSHVVVPQRQRDRSAASPQRAESVWTPSISRVTYLRS